MWQGNGKRLIAIVFIMVILPCFPAWSEQDVVEKFVDGEINWTKGIVSARGFGVPPENIHNIAQGQIYAERAATAVARRNLLELTNGVRVTSETTVKNFIIKSDIIRSRVSGFVKGSKIVERKFHEDGSVEVTVAMPLTGDFLKVVLDEIREPTLRLPLAPPPSKKPDLTLTPPSPPASPSIPSVTEPVSPTPPAVEKDVVPPQKSASSRIDLSKLDYTGLIVDARGLGVRPALLPRIISESGAVLYSQASVAEEKLLKMGLVGYAKDVGAARTHFRVSADPIVISGINVAGTHRSDVLINNSDARAIQTTEPAAGYLKKGRVMVVYD